MYINICTWYIYVYTCTSGEFTRKYTNAYVISKCTYTYAHVVHLRIHVYMYIHVHVNLPDTGWLWLVGSIK